MNEPWLRLRSSNLELYRPPLVKKPSVKILVQNDLCEQLLGLRLYSKPTAKSKITY